MNSEKLRSLRRPTDCCCLSSVRQMLSVAAVVVVVDDDERGRSLRGLWDVAIVAVPDDCCCCCCCCSLSLISLLKRRRWHLLRSESMDNVGSAAEQLRLPNGCAEVPLAQSSVASSLIEYEVDRKGSGGRGVPRAHDGVDGGHPCCCCDDEMIVEFGESTERTKSLLPPSAWAASARQGILYRSPRSNSRLHLKQRKKRKKRHQDNYIHIERERDLCLSQWRLSGYFFCSQFNGIRR